MKMQTNEPKSSQHRAKGKRVPAAAVVMLGGASIAHAATLTAVGPIHASGPLTSLVAASGTKPVTVVSGSVFDVTVVGFNSLGGAYIAGPVTATFGTTQTFDDETVDGSVLTVTSGESVSGGLTTDTFTISIPTSFDPSGTTLGGSPITEMEADFGGYNAGTNGIQFVTPINPTSLTVGGSLNYSGGTFVLGPVDTLSNGNQTLAGAEGVNAGGADLGDLAINSFTFTATYAVPEPATVGIFVSLAGAALLRRRRR